ncbi:MAG: hypothetical protein RI942_2499 [Pseudomonadota bacterium]|jgi:DNA-binding response OmpR family regulator
MVAADTFSGLTILVVEDDFNLREAILDALSSQGHAVRGIECAEAVPEQADLLQLDCAILDLNLPGEDGVSLAKRLRASHPDLGIIMLSARARSEDRGVGYASGADIYLTKPASLAELNQALMALARRLKRNLTNHEGGVCLHVKGLMLSHAEQQIALTKSEAALLAAFVRAAQNTLETWQIAEAVGLDLDTIKKTLIELHVSRLRKKLPIIGGVTNPIKAIRGLGYQLCIPVQLVV